MEISREKVAEAIRALKAAADELLYQRGHHGEVAGQCITAVAALEASLSMAGQPRVIHFTGESD